MKTNMFRLYRKTLSAAALLALAASSTSEVKAFPVVVTAASGDVLTLIKTILDEAYQAKDLFLQLSEIEKEVKREIQAAKDIAKTVDRLAHGDFGSILEELPLWDELNDFKSEIESGIFELRDTVGEIKDTGMEEFYRFKNTIEAIPNEMDLTLQRYTKMNTDFQKKLKKYEEIGAKRLDAAKKLGEQLRDIDQSSDASARALQFLEGTATVEAAKNTASIANILEAKFKHENELAQTKLAEFHEKKENARESVKDAISGAMDAKTSKALAALKTGGGTAARVLAPVIDAAGKPLQPDWEELLKVSTPPLGK
jgi:hypothetical protein